MVDIGQIRAHARTLLESGQVQGVLGYRRGSAGAMAEPAYVTDAGDVDSLVWDPTCVHNLALNLVNERKRLAASRSSDRRPIAMVAKGCDSRAIVVLLQENKVRREDVHIIGVSCGASGVVDLRKVAAHLRGKAATEVAFDGPDYRVATAKGEEAVAGRDVMADRCLECRHAFPKVNDAVFGEEVAERDLNPRFHALCRIEAMPEAERSAFWSHHFDRCIRCFACRSVCPMCYCDECVVDSISMLVLPETTAEEKANRIRWIERSPSSSENAMYHLVRAMHLAGRCIDCAECERVCPVNIPVRLLNNTLEKEAFEAFEYLPGSDPAEPSLISAFRDGDPNDFIR